MTSDLESRRKADALVSRADAIQFSDAAFREELSYWIGQGVFGTPWLLAKLSQLAASYLDLSKYADKQDSDLLMSAPAFAILCSVENDHESQVKVGQVFERIALTAAALGISVQPMSQIVQVPETRAEPPSGPEYVGVVHASTPDSWSVPVNATATGWLYQPSAFAPRTDA